MKRYRVLVTVMLAAMALIAGCTSNDETADETTTAAPATTVAPPETATTAASTTSTTMSLTAAIATAEALHEAFNASDPGAALAVFAEGAFDGGLLPGSPEWEEPYAGARAVAWGRRSTLSDCEATGKTLTCLETWERTNLSGKAGVIRVHEWSFRFDDQGLITNHKGESVSGYEDDRAFEAALGNWMATAHPESYETFYNPESNGINEETWLSGIDELSPLIDEFIAQSDDYPLGDAAAATTTSTSAATSTGPVTVDYTGTSRMLDVYRPEGSGPWPVVVVAHGAGQNRYTFEMLAREIAAEGAVVFNIDYDATPPFVTGIENVACAIRFARARAADYDGDPSRITLVGNSAGAVNGVIVGMAGDDFAGDCVVTEGSALIDALVLYEGGYDRSTQPHMPGFDPLALKEEDPELWAATNPYLLIGGNPDLVVRLIHGDDTDDNWYDLPPAVSVEFHQALVDAGYDAELALLEGASHKALTGSLTQAGAEARSVTVQQVMQVAAD